MKSTKTLTDRREKSRSNENVLASVEFVLSAELHESAETDFVHSIAGRIIAEPEGGAHRDYHVSAANLGEALRQNLEKLLDQPTDQLLKKRYKKFRALGNFAEAKA